jgi:hypothetical protein|eukprot:SAG25_NODE_310_length_10020_cov_8.397440_2_plen_80_part_00
MATERTLETLPRRRPPSSALERLWLRRGGDDVVGDVDRGDGDGELLMSSRAVGEEEAAGDARSCRPPDLSQRRSLERSC